MTSNSQVSKKPLSHPGKPPHKDMVWIPERTFQMGADNSKYPEEAPAHTVTVSGFWMDRYLVTNKQFQKFVKETGYVTFAEKPLDTQKILILPLTTLVFGRLFALL